MKHRILQLIALFVLIVTMSSCYMGSYGTYKKRGFYGHRKQYYNHHKHRHGGW